MKQKSSKKEVQSLKPVWQVPLLEIVKQDAAKGLFTPDELKRLYQECAIDNGYPEIVGQSLYKEAKRLYEIPEKYYVLWNNEFIAETKELSELLKKTNFSIEYFEMQLRHIFIRIMMSMEIAYRPNSSDKDTQNSSK